MKSCVTLYQRTEDGVRILHARWHDCIYTTPGDLKFLIRRRNLVLERPNFWIWPIKNEFGTNLERSAPKNEARRFLVPSRQSHWTCEVASLRDRRFFLEISSTRVPTANRLEDRAGGSGFLGLQTVRQKREILRPQKRRRRTKIRKVLNKFVLNNDKAISITACSIIWWCWCEIHWNATITPPE